MTAAVNVLNAFQISSLNYLADLIAADVSHQVYPTAAQDALRVLIEDGTRAKLTQVQVDTMYLVAEIVQEDVEHDTYPRATLGALQTVLDVHQVTCEG